MMAMTSDDTKITVPVPEAVQKELLCNNQQIIRDIESQNSVVIDLNTTTHELSIQGDELEVVLARSLIDEQIEKFKKLNVDYNVDSLSESLKEVSISNNIRNFALKLGYKESDIQQAANICINNRMELNEDTILKELTKKSHQKQNDENSIHESYTEEDFVARTVAEYTSEQSTKENDDLRGIVIDGSNVAMW